MKTSVTRFGVKLINALTMKISRYIIAAASIVALTACARETVQPVQDSNDIITFEAVQADTDASTKTVIENETAVYWSPKESIKIFYGSKTSGKFVSSNTTPVAITDFSGSFDMATGGINAGPTAYDFWAVYPYSSQFTCDGSSVTISLPTEQTAAEGTFGPDLFPSVAKSSNLSLAFYNVCGGIMFTVSQPGIQSVIFKGKNNENIAGSAKIGMDANGKPVVQSFTSGAKEITVNAPEGTSFKTGVKYYLVAFPQSFSNGFEFKYSKISSEAVYSSTSSVSISRSVFAKLENKDSDLTFEPISGNIDFADDLAKNACVAKFDTDTDGEISYAEAYAVTSLNNLFENYVKVTSFEELKYFVNVTNLKGCFYGCSELKTVTIPENITVIGDNAFRNCSALETLTIPETVTSIGTKAFNGCTKLEAITIAASVTEIGSLAFDSNIKTITMLGTTPPSIDNDSFVVGTVFYVPKEAIQTYKNASNWTAHKDKIFRICPDGAVDLGLSVFWASCNIGAESPEDYGRYFAWADVVGQTWNGSSWSGGGFSDYLPYELDPNNNLKPEYDAAHVLLGGNWRMPTASEYQELFNFNNCHSVWTSNYEDTGVAGMIFSSIIDGYEGKSIFLPAAGYGSSGLSDAGSIGYCWSSTFSNSTRAMYLDFRSQGVDMSLYSIYHGFPVRPVSE